jgi:lipoic acid synthetase
MNPRANLAKPDWIRVKPPSSSCFDEVRAIIKTSAVRTVCDSSQCPNISECWGRGTATFMILGDTCTRSCRFCSVRSGAPKGRFDLTEPSRVAQAVLRLGIQHAVVTSVTRDDLVMGGASVFAATTEAIRSLTPKVTVETLVPDFQGNRRAIEMVLHARPEIFAHNLEVVRNVQGIARDHRASYERSLAVLRLAKELSPGIMTKSSLMVGLGEDEEGMEEAFIDLRSSGVDVLTIGQYLRPKGGNLEVQRYYTPEEFDGLRRKAKSTGFIRVIAGPMVRSSYHAKDALV